MGKEIPAIDGFKIKDSPLSVNKNKIVAKYWDGRTETYSKAINFKSFYGELHDVFATHPEVKFLDDIGGDSPLDNQVKSGEHIDNKLYKNRTSDMYERKFIWNKNISTGTIELEMEWKIKAKLAYSGYGIAKIKIDLVNRFIDDKEILEGNKKTILQGGSWEFRNEIEYENTIITDVINKFPIIKYHNWIKKLLLDYFYKKDIENDLIEIEQKVIPAINGTIKKYFN